MATIYCQSGQCATEYYYWHHKAHLQSPLVTAINLGLYATAWANGEEGGQKRGGVRTLTGLGCVGLCGLAGRMEDRAGGDPDRAGLCGTVWASGEDGGQSGGGLTGLGCVGLCGLTGRREDRAGSGL